MHKCALLHLGNVLGKTSQGKEARSVIVVRRTRKQTLLKISFKSQPPLLQKVSERSGIMQLFLSVARQGSSTQDTAVIAGRPRMPVTAPQPIHAQQGGLSFSPASFSESVEATAASRQLRLAQNSRGNVNSCVMLGYCFYTLSQNWASKRARASLCVLRLELILWHWN